MSYEFVFWKVSDDVSLQRKHELYGLLADGEVLPGCESVDVSEALAAVSAEFSDWERIGKNVWDGDGGFQVSTSSFGVIVSCYDMPSAQRARLQRIMAAVGLSVFDPQRSVESVQ